MATTVFCFHAKWKMTDRAFISHAPQIAINLFATGDFVWLPLFVWMQILKHIESQTGTANC